MKITQANSYCNNINTTLEKITFLLHTFSKLQTLLPRLLHSRLLFLPKTVNELPSVLYSLLLFLLRTVDDGYYSFSLFLRFPPKVENGAS